MKTRRILFPIAALVAVVVGTNIMFGQTAGSVPLPKHASTPVVSCAGMPQLWSGAIEIGYLPDVHRVSFEWPLPDAVDVTGKPVMAEVEVSADSAGCPTQPGLATFLRDLVAAEKETALQSCLDLKELAAIVRAANPAAMGKVPVPAEADALVMARRHPDALQGAEGEAFRASMIARNQQVPRTLDLAQADAEVAAGCA